jgi:serine/threonine protein phosphatase 1
MQNRSKKQSSTTPLKEASSRVFVVGDIHGNAKALKQVIERSEIDKEKDTLISLGDIVDGYNHTYECVEELLTFKNLIGIRGNHDEWFKCWLSEGKHPDRWRQGGFATAFSYLKEIGKENLIDRSTSTYLHALLPSDIPHSHAIFFDSQRNYYIDDKKRLFIHGGFNRHFPLSEQEQYVYYWDRDLFLEALSYKAMTRNKFGDKELKFKLKDDFSEIYVGHTTTLNWGTTEPINAAMIWNMDTGGGEREGRVTIMDIDTKQYWQSDLGKELYPDERGR